MAEGRRNDPVEIARGRFHGPMRKFGNNPNAGTGEETLWDGSSLYTYMSAAGALTIVSGEAADKGVATASTGARTAEVQGLDENYVLQTETVTLNGTDAVTLTKTWIRVFRVKVLTAGSGRKNAGIIQVKSGSTVVAQIAVGKNQTLMALFTVPANSVGYIEDIYFGNASNKVVEAYLYVRPFGQVFQVKRVFHLYREPFQYKYAIPFKVEPMSDIEIRHVAESAGDPVSGGFTLWYEDAG